MKKLEVIKIGGKVINNQVQLDSVLSAFARLKGPKILVHGGGSMASQMECKLGLTPNMVEGRRITDASSIDVVTMVYAGLINKKIVAGLQREGCNALGLAGVDGNAILSQKRPVISALNGEQGIDYGFVGDVTQVNRSLVSALLEAGLVPVFSAITHDGSGQLLNTNADTVATEIARALAANYRVNLTFAFAKAGVLDAEAQVISQINERTFAQLRSDGTVSEGMVPKLTNAFKALHGGVAQVKLASAEYLTHKEPLFTRIVLS